MGQTFLSKSVLGGKMSAELVWENASLESEFAEQDIQLSVDASEYKFGIAEFRYSTSSNVESLLVLKLGNRSYLQNMLNIATSSEDILFMHRSIIVRQSDNVMNLSNAYTKSTCEGSVNKDNSRLIPRRVWLFK